MDPNRLSDSVIIENTVEAKEVAEQLFGNCGDYHVHLSERDRVALANGQCLAVDIRREYTVFITFGEQKTSLGYDPVVAMREIHERLHPNDSLESDPSPTESGGKE